MKHLKAFLIGAGVVGVLTSTTLLLSFCGIYWPVSTVVVGGIALLYGVGRLIIYLRED